MQLYTARGEQGMGTSTNIADKSGVVLSEEAYDSLLKTHCTYTESNHIRKRKAYAMKRPLFTLKTTPAFLELENDYYMFYSLPQYSFMAKKNFDNLPIMNLMLWLDDSVKNDKTVLHQIADDFEKGSKPGYTMNIKLAYQDKESVEDVLKIIDIVFYVTIGIIMFLCFFSLVASMTANVFS